MVNTQIVALLQGVVDSLINTNGANYNSKYNGYTCIIHDEIDYQFRKGTPKLIEANVLFGSATKNNDLEDKYNMNFVVNIQSEVNGGEIAKSLFDDVFKLLARTYHTLGQYNSKVFITSPVLMQSFVEIEDSFCNLYTMNGSVEFSENIVLGATYELSLDGTNFITIKPRQPYSLKECMGAMDTSASNPQKSTFTKSSNQFTYNCILIYEQKENNANFNALFNALLDECYGNSNNKYTLKETTGTIVKTIDNLLCIRGQKSYDETTGENVLSLQFKQAT